MGWNWISIPYQVISTNYTNTIDWKDNTDIDNTNTKMIPIPLNTWYDAIWKKRDTIDTNDTNEDEYHWRYQRYNTKMNTIDNDDANDEYH